MRSALTEQTNDAGSGIPHVLLSILPAGVEDTLRELAQLPEGPPDLDWVAAICGRYGVRFVEP